MNFHHRVFMDDQESNQAAVSANSHNKRVIKQMIVYSPLSSLMMLVILVLFLVCIITDLVKGYLALSTISGSTLIMYGANSNTLVNKGQVWRLFTAMFLHAGGFHLLMNSTSFLLYLMPVEQKTKNKWLYLLVLILGGMLGNMLSVSAYNLRLKQLLAVGASTSICSVIGFDFAYRILRVNDQPLQSRRLFITLFYLFLISMIPGVDFYGHFGSLLGGFWIGTAFLKPSWNYWNERQIKFIKLFGSALIVGYTGILVFLIAKYQKWQ